MDEVQTQLVAVDVERRAARVSAPKYRRAVSDGPPNMADVPRCAVTTYPVGEEDRKSRNVRLLGDAEVIAVGENLPTVFVGIHVVSFEIPAAGVAIVCPSVGDFVVVHYILFYCLVFD